MPQPLVMPAPAPPRPPGLVVARPSPQPQDLVTCRNYLCSSNRRTLPTPPRLRRVNAGACRWLRLALPILALYHVLARPLHVCLVLQDLQGDSLTLLGFRLPRTHCAVGSVKARLTRPVPLCPGPAQMQSCGWEDGGPWVPCGDRVPHTDLASYFEVKAGNGFSPSRSCWETLFPHWSLKHHMVGVVSDSGSPRKRTNYGSPSPESPAFCILKGIPLKYF